MVIACSSWRWRSLHIDRVVLHLDRVRPHVFSHRPTQQLAGPHVEGREVQRTLDDVALEASLRAQLLALTACVAELIERCIDVRDQHPLTIDDDPDPRPWSERT